MRYRSKLSPTDRSELTIKEKMMTSNKSDASDSQGENQRPQPRGGAAGEDRSKDLYPEQSGGPFGGQKEGKAGTEKNSSGEQKR